MSSADAPPPAELFSPTQVILHWAVALLVTVQLFFDEAIQHDFDRLMTEEGGWPSLMGWTHILGGLAILVLAVWRLALRLSRGAPEAAMPAPKVAILAGKAAHLALYGFLLLLPVSGVFALLGRSDLSAELHELLQWLLVPLILGHAVGALIEHSVFRNATLSRMLTFSGTETLEERANGG